MSRATPRSICQLLMSVKQELIFGRRHFLALAAALPAWRAGASTPQTIVCLDYGIASTLLSLGVVPAGIAALADWNTWVVEPTLPSGIIDVGSAWEVNFELLAAMKPDLILTTPYLDSLKPQLERMGPVLRLEVFSAEGGNVLPKAVSATRTLAEAIDRKSAGETFLEQANRFFDACRERITRLSPPTIALISLMDERHARIYGAPGLYQNVLDRLGLENAWKKQANYWGFSTIGIEELSVMTDPGIHVIAFEPLPGDALDVLQESPLWQAQTFIRSGHFGVLPASLMFGMVNEATRFARLLTDYLETTA